MRVAYDPRDLSKVLLRGPDEVWRGTRFADLRRPPSTLWELRRAQKALKERGSTLVDEELIFETIERQRGIVDEASRRTKEARRFMARRDCALDGAATQENSGASARGAKTELDEQPIDFSKVTTFPVEEWSRAAAISSRTSIRPIAAMRRSPVASASSGSRPTPGSDSIRRNPHSID
jgi:putative transposase